MSVSLGDYKHSNSSITAGPVGLVATPGWQIRSRLAQALSWDRLFAPVDTASLAVVRIALGFLIAVDSLRYGQRLFYPSGGVLPFQFRYQFFHWVQEYPDLSFYLPLVLFISGIALSIGLFFRVSSVLCLILISYGFLLQPEFYLNHFYMLIILLFLLCISPAHRSFSIDKYLFPSRHGVYAPGIYLFLLKAQLEIILIYAGLVKLNSDWLQLEPLRTWLIARRDMPYFGDLWQSELIIAIGVYGTILLHVVGAPLLLFARTRLPVFVIYCIFHITNHFVFEIGIFPWMTIACTTLFFPADWPRRVSGLWRQSRPMAEPKLIAAPKSFAAQALVVFTAFWIAFQTLFPLRHFLYPGWVEWTNEGHRFAWRMKLTDRRSPGVLLAVYIPELKTVHVPDLIEYLSDGQYERISTVPDLIQQLAWQVRDLYKKELRVGEVKVFAYAPMTLNNRSPALVIDPAVDLGATHSTLWPASWVTKSNPNPLRRIEDVNTKVEIETKPDLQQVLAKMGLPKPKSCHGPGETTPTLVEEAVCYLD